MAAAAAGMGVELGDKIHKNILSTINTFGNQHAMIEKLRLAREAQDQQNMMNTLTRQLMEQKVAQGTSDMDWNRRFRRAFSGR